MYVKILQSLYDGTWTKDDLWWLAAEGAAILGGDFDSIINPKFVGDLKAVKIKTPDLGDISAYDLVVMRYEQMKKGADVFEPFTGPIHDNTGALKVKKDVKASKGELLSIMYYVDNVVGSIPK
jgi:simple sugar transport system substrate-binding protein